MKNQTSKSAIAALFLSALFSVSCNDADHRDDDADSTTRVGAILDSAGSSINNAADKVEDAFAGYSDSSFVTEAIASNETEIKLLNEGIAKGTSATVKKHARSMKEDHTRLLGQLKAYAKKMNYTIPAPSDEEANDAKEDLNDHKSGDDWDKAWTDLMISEHRKAIDKFSTASEEATDPPLKTLVDAALPVLQSHRDMLEKMPASM